MHDAVAIRFQTEQHRGVGTRFVCDTKVGPIELVDRMEITEWEPGVAMGVRHAGVVTGTGRSRLTPIDLGRRTRFAWTEELQLPVVARRPGRRADRRPYRDATDLESQPHRVEANRRRARKRHVGPAAPSTQRLALLRKTSKAFVDHHAQATRTGWKNKRVSLAASEFKPNASSPSMN